MGYKSTHTAILDEVEYGKTVIDMCYGVGYLTKELVDKGCTVYGYYETITPEATALCKKCLPLELYHCDYSFSDITDPIDVVIIGDTISRFYNPQKILTAIREKIYHEQQKVIITAANIGFFPKRIGLLIGQFNYNRTGTTDFSSKRLFTFTSLARAIEYAGYRIDAIEGIPAPFPLIFGNNGFSKFLLWLNMKFIMVSKGLFAYQILIKATPKPPLHQLLENAKGHREEPL